MEEKKTLITFYQSNGHTSYSQFCEGVENGELLKLCAMMEMAKLDILSDLKDEYMNED